jgi:integrase
VKKAKLTDITIRNLKPGATRREIPDPGAASLYVVVQPSGRHGYAVRYRFAGKSRKLTLARGIGLAAARKAAADAMHEVAQGRDPCQAKMIAKQKAADATADTLQAVAADYLKREGSKLRTVKQRVQIFERLVYPALGSRPIAEIKRSDVIKLLDTVEDNNGARMADEVLMIVRKLMNWHASRSDDFRSPIVRGMARTVASDRARDRILSDDELRRVWQASPPDTVAGAFIRTLILTAARRMEVAAMPWSELEGNDWILPKARNKIGEELVRPLSAAALQVLDGVPRIVGCPFVFSNGSRPIANFSSLKRDLDKRSGVTGWRLHDLRRTARSLLSRAGVGADIAERCLGHTIGGVRGIYDRHTYQPEMKLAYEKLAGLVAGIVDPQDNVRQLEWCTDHVSGRRAAEPA